MDAEEMIWQDVPEPEQLQDFIVDEPKPGENNFTVVAELELGEIDVVDTLYIIGGVWRVEIADRDDDEDVPSGLLNVIVDRRFKVEEVRAAVIKVLENLYSLEL